MSPVARAPARNLILPPSARPARLALFALLALFAALPIGAQADVVFVTESGLSYHREDCPRLGRTRRALRLPLPEAAALGYSPCGVCRAPLPPGAAPGAPAPAPPGLYRVDTSGVTRCEPGELARMPRALVVRPVDGDTVYVALPRPPDGLRQRERLRLLGVDCPEPGQADPARRRMAQAAGEFTRRRLEGRVVHLAFDWQLRDRYGRLLAYVYLPDGSCHNAQLLREGYAHAYTRFPFRFLGEFRALERAARQRGLGLWALAAQAPDDPATDAQPPSGPRADR